MRHFFYIGIILCCFIEHVQAQKVDKEILIDSIKSDLTSFFIKEGFLDSQKIMGSRNYVYATEIKQKRPIGYDTNGIYRIGVYQSHSSEYILIKQKNEFRIFNLEEIGKVLNEVISYSEKNNVDIELMLVYVEEVINIYHNNHHTGNIKLNKAQ